MVQGIWHVATVWAADRPVLTSLRDLMIVPTGAGLVVQAVGGPSGGFQLSSWSLGGLGLLGTAVIPGPGLTGTLPELHPITLPGGQAATLMLGDGQSGIAGLWSGGSGGFGAAFATGGTAAGIMRDITALATTVQGSAAYAYGLQPGSQQPSVWQIGANGRFDLIAQGQATPGSSGLPARGLTDVVTLGNHVAAAGTGNTLMSVWQIGAGGGLTLTDSIGAAANPGLGGQVTLAAASPGGRAHVIAAAAQSSTLSVWEVTSTGRLVLTDHVIDSAHSRFQGAIHLETLTVQDQTWVAAGGADSGISLFRLTPTGRLVQVAQIADGLGWSMDGLAAMSLAMGPDGRVHIFAAGLRDGGISHFTHMPGTGQIIEGGTTADTLIGTPGADILRDGGGSDAMTGGPGADIFVLDTDGLTDTITDFEPGIDRIDLSGWAFWRGAHQLAINSRVTGAEVTFDGPAGLERLIIDTVNGQPLSHDQVIAALLPGPDRFLNIWLDTSSLRPPDPPRPPGQRLDGTPQRDALQGGASDDTIYGLSGDDRLGGGGGDDLVYGGVGFDTLMGGDGNDMLYGMDGYDRLSGGTGNDLLLGNNGNDTLEGDAGHDTLSGGFGADVLYGGDGDDSLSGGSGDDVAEGGAGNDRIEGNAGADTLLGGAGDDVLIGGINNDQIHGGPGNDRMQGDNGADTLWGGDGDDLIFGNAGPDVLWGGDGQDTLDGGINHDWLHGGAGDDLVIGNNGNDTLHGGAGSDTLYGNSGADVLEGGGGVDLLFGGQGPDSFVFRGGTVIVGDFMLGVDSLFLDRALWGGANRTPQQILSQARVIDGAVTLDFGSAGRLELSGVSDVQGLRDDLFLI